MTGMSDLTKLVERLKALEAKGTPRPWMLYRASDARAHELYSQHAYCGASHHKICEIEHHGWDAKIAKDVSVAQLENAELIESAVNALPALLSAIDRLSTQVEELRGALAKFAEDEDACNSNVPDARHPLVDYGTGTLADASFTIGDIRKARALASEQTGG